MANSETKPLVLAKIPYGIFSEFAKPRRKGNSLGRGGWAAEGGPQEAPRKPRFAVSDFESGKKPGGFAWRAKARAGREVVGLPTFQG